MGCRMRFEKTHSLELDRMEVRYRYLDKPDFQIFADTAERYAPEELDFRIFADTAERYAPEEPDFRIFADTAAFSIPDKEQFSDLANSLDFLETVGEERYDSVHV